MNKKYLHNITYKINIEILKGQCKNYLYYINSPKPHQVYRVNGASPILFTEIYLYYLSHALDNIYKKKDLIILN